MILLALQCQLEDVNFFKLCATFDKSELCRKLFGFASRMSKTSDEANNTTTKATGRPLAQKPMTKSKPPDIQRGSEVVVSAMYSVSESSIAINRCQVKNFLHVMQAHDVDGRIIIQVDTDGSVRRKRWAILRTRSH